ncbi:MAG: diguanylate cyclase domain-containing protein [Chthoniobacterales bacterium]|jgi:diguanylate cyclase (GGDEF)-like protein
MNTSNQPRILIVEDEAITAMDLAAELRGLGYDVCGTADTAEGALEAVEREAPDLVLMDIRLGGGGDGIDAASRLSGHQDVAVVFLTAHSDEETLSRALAVSPYGYIVKPFRARELKVAVELALSKHAAQQAATEKMSELVLTDPLTGLANRRHFDQTLASEWDRAAREDHSLAVLMVDIDHFKRFNDTHGHAAGDVCLQTVARAMQEHCGRPGDLVCRWGGEEFAVILPATDAAGAMHLACELVEVVRSLGLAHGNSPAAPVVTISVGAAAAQPDEGGTAAALVEKADAALYAAKQAGRNRADGAG